MARFRIALTPGAFYFFTVVTLDRRPVLTIEPVRRALSESIRAVRQRAPFGLPAIVLLPDHLHCVWALPDGDADYATRWSLIERLTAQAVRSSLPAVASPAALARRELGLWQRRFWEHQIRDESDLERHLDYIHWNPVKHGLVAAPSAWPYSSFQSFVARGLYPRDWGSHGANAEASDFGEPES